MPSKDETKMEFAARMENIFSESIGIPVSHYYSDNALIFGKALSLEVPVEGMIIKTINLKAKIRSCLKILTHFFIIKEDALDVAAFDVHSVCKSLRISISEILEDLGLFIPFHHEKTFSDFLREKYSNKDKL